AATARLVTAVLKSFSGNESCRGPSASPHPNRQSATHGLVNPKQYPPPLRRLRPPPAVRPPPAAAPPSPPSALPPDRCARGARGYPAGCRGGSGFRPLRARGSRRVGRAGARGWVGVENEGRPIVRGHAQLGFSWAMVRRGQRLFFCDAGRDRILSGLGEAVRAAPVEASTAEANGWRDWGERKNAR
ncbi:MAG: hypothetical protein RL077_4275, partial [Verrucomicrobiota bacterium]